MTYIEGNEKMEILQPGFLTTVQDYGRYGYMRFGFSPSGVMDRNAYDLGNRMLNNTNGEAALEMTWTGISARFFGDATLVLTGAEMEAKRNEEPLPFGIPFTVHEGDILTIGAAKSGCRTYLCAAGGIDVPVVMGSRSTNLRCGLGGFAGRSLQKGDRLRIGPTNLMYPGMFPPEMITASVPKTDTVRLRVIPDEQEKRFSWWGIQTFYRRRYIVTNDSDRMGCRLSGPAIESRDYDIISEGIALGAVQVPPSGQPIILLADRQTTGGYIKIGTVFSPDLSLLAQCRPGTGIRFEKMKLEEAYRLLRRNKYRGPLQKDEGWKKYEKSRCKL